jgi:hypothetical protein
MVDLSTRFTFLPVTLPLPLCFPIKLLSFPRVRTFDFLLLDVPISISQIAIYRRARGVVELEQLPAATLAQTSTFRGRSEEGTKARSLWWIGARDV